MRRTASGRWVPGTPAPAAAPPGPLPYEAYLLALYAGRGTAAAIGDERIARLACRGALELPNDPFEAMKHE